jgi:hypothetical protein
MKIFRTTYMLHEVNTTMGGVKNTPYMWQPSKRSTKRAYKRQINVYMNIREMKWEMGSRSWNVSRITSPFSTANRVTILSSTVANCRQAQSGK